MLGRMREVVGQQLGEVVCQLILKLWYRRKLLIPRGVPPLPEDLRAGRSLKTEPEPNPFSNGAGCSWNARWRLCAASRPRYPPSEGVCMSSSSQALAEKALTLLAVLGMAS